MNMKMNPVALSISLALCVSTQATRADIAWYGAAEGSWSNLDSDINIINASSGSTARSGSVDDNAGGAGLFLGIRNETGVHYIGGEIGIESGASDAGGADPGDSNVTLSIEDNYTASLAAVGGYRINPKTHLTGRIGVVSTDFDVAAIGSGTGLGGPYLSSSDSERLTGLILGIGFSYQLSDRMALRAEYRYTDYLNEASTGQAGDPSSNQFYEFDDITRDAFTLGLRVDF
jgi:outer membrane immunogenic protein